MVKHLTKVNRVVVVKIDLVVGAIGGEIVIQPYWDEMTVDELKDELEFLEHDLDECEGIGALQLCEEINDLRRYINGREHGEWGS